MTDMTDPPDAPTTTDVQRYRRYLQGEVDGAYQYRALGEIAGAEDSNLADVYARLAAMEERHLALWREELRRAGADDTLPRPSRRARVLVWLARRLGTEALAPVMKALERGADAAYASDPVATAAGLPRDEREHARTFEAISRRGGGLAGSVIGRIESRHRALGGSNALRASVLGANDGLVSSLALVMGVAGAAPGQATVVLAGVAGLLAGAFSMALGEWVSVTSSREAAEAQLAAEREEIERAPEEEREELALIYQAKGLSRPEAEALSAQIMSDPTTALHTLAREELGIIPEELGSPWAAAIASFVLFSFGAALPVVPFLVAGRLAAIAASAALSAFGLFALGASITLLTGRSAWYSGARQVLLGLAAAAVTFLVGSLVGAVTGI